MNSFTRFTLILLLIILALPSLAQEKPRLGLQFNYLVPLNEFPLAHRIKFSYSAKVLFRFEMSNKFMGQFGGGYGEYAGNDFDGAYYKTIIVPMEFKLMYLLSDSKTVKPYFLGGIGGMPYHVKTKPHFIKGLYEEGFAGYAEGGLGVQFELGGPIALDLSAGIGITTIDNLNYYVDGAAKDGYCFAGIGIFFGGGFVDSDGDGVPDNADKCPGTPKGVKVDNFGCPLDGDGDGVYDYLDNCPDTPKGVAVDSHGCPVDSDGDGVPDNLDKCANTPAGVKVDSNGCPLDADGDGVPDYLDKCANTPSGVTVDKDGCPLDSDGDGVPDYLDKCPNTPKGTSVDANGCPVVKEETKLIVPSGDAYFEFAKSDLLPAAFPVLDKLAETMKKNPDYKWTIEGNTDSIGTDAFNMKLSERRAQSVVSYLIQKGVDKNIITVKAFGKTNPVADNGTEEGRAKNRRVEIKIIK